MYASYAKPTSKGQRYWHDNDNVRVNSSIFIFIREDEFDRRDGDQRSDIVGTQSKIEYDIGVHGEFESCQRHAAKYK